MPKIPLETINKLLKCDAAATVRSSEAEFSEKIDNIVDILCKKKDVKIVLLSGPSASGKTTSANIIKDRLINNGHQAIVISLDNFFKNEDNYPLKPDGNPDFESVNALDIDLLNSCLDNIIKKGASYMPKYSFKDKCRNDKHEWVEIEPDGFVIVEGIHGLNPIISNGLPKENIIKLFVSVSTGITDENRKEILSGIEIRFLRRLVRDSLYRNTDAKRTLRLWPGVLEGEHKYLYPYKPLADMKLNTFHVCEVGIIKDYALNVMKDERNNNDFCSRICGVLERFISVPSEYVSEYSLLREFISGGIYENLY
jgi:uridine kinase